MTPPKKRKLKAELINELTNLKKQKEEPMSREEMFKFLSDDNTRPDEEATKKFMKQMESMNEDEQEAFNREAILNYMSLNFIQMFLAKIRGNLIQNHMLLNMIAQMICKDCQSKYHEEIAIVNHLIERANHLYHDIREIEEAEQRQRTWELITISAKIKMTMYNLFSSLNKEHRYEEDKENHEENEGR